jgi:hypothetical protein
MLELAKAYGDFLDRTIAELGGEPSSAIAVMNETGGGDAAMTTDLVVSAEHLDSERDALAASLRVRNLDRIPLRLLPMSLGTRHRGDTGLGTTDRIEA